MHPWKGTHDYLKDDWAGSKEENICYLSVSEDKDIREISFVVKGKGRKL